MSDLQIFCDIFNEIQGKRTKINRLFDFFRVDSSGNRLLKEFKLIKKRLPAQFYLLYLDKYHLKKKTNL